MAVTWLGSRVDITPSSADTWEDQDLTAHASGAAGVLIRVHCNNGNIDIGWRENGSTDARTTQVLAQPQIFNIWVGLDSNDICELYTSDTTNGKFYLEAYADGNDEVFLTNGQDVSLGSTGSWTDIDISSYTTGTAIAAGIELDSTGNYRTSGLRMNGSTDDRVKYWSNHGFQMVGVDANEIFEGQIDNTEMDFYLTCYWTDAGSWNTNATDNSMTSTGSWADLSAAPAGSLGTAFEIYMASDAQYRFDLRPNGSSVQDWEKCCRRSFILTELDGSQLAEGIIENTAVDFYELGYIEAGGGAVADLEINVHDCGEIDTILL